ncbi:hypothetical protein XENTR_v10016539 [Xenopus tropicalis]|nr:hypothetical protein XENTR_v10016539 [Xenopus tropicalis]KAE8597628.1 hypothetical protein XENTR_v10016539 [Xenopus tropicalis]
MESMGDRLSVIRSFLDNGFPDKGSHTCTRGRMSYKYPVFGEDITQLGKIKDTTTKQNNCFGRMPKPMQ